MKQRITSVTVLFFILFCLSFNTALAKDKSKNQPSKDTQDETTVNTDVTDSIVALQTGMNNIYQNTSNVKLSENVRFSVYSSDGVGGFLELGF